MSKTRQNRAESIRQRLRNLLRERGEDVQFGLPPYATERFLYRLGASAHRERFVLKGAALFALWGGSLYRPTRDLDFTGYGSAEEESVLAALRDICLQPSATDELLFDPDTLSAEPIRDDSEYHGLRIRLAAALGTSRIPIQIDIGFGNAIEPSPQDAEYPTLLDDPAPRIRTYPPEAVVAEKLHAMVVLGERTSRYKDFYDVHVLAQQFRFDGDRLARAIAATFERRRTPIDAMLPAALAPRFFADEARAAQWRAYLIRNNLPGAPANLGDVGETLTGFLGPVWSALAEKVAFTSGWPPGGTWNSERGENEISNTARTSSSQTSRARRYSDNADMVSVEDIEIPITTPLRRFKPYPAYKDSGVEWLGEIPTHWNVVPLKRLGELQAGAGFPEEEQGVTDEVLPFFKVGDMAESDDGKHLISAPNTVSTATAKRLRAFVFTERTIVFAKVGAALLLNRRRILTRPSCIDNNMMGFTPRACEAEWAFYWLAGLDFGELANPGAVPSINEGQVRETPAIVPLPREQRAIAAFLDRETAKIDALVAKKERLIDLLQEKRTALITRAVTKGLDRNVPMKESGVEWLGEIPAHWEVKRIKWVARMESGHTPDKKIESYWQGGDIPWISLADTGQLREVDHIANTAVMTTADGVEHSSAHLLPAGTVVFSRDATIGLCAITATEMAVSQHFIGWVCSSRLHPEYLLFVLRTMMQELERLTMGATVRTIGMPDVRSLATPIPPMPEQERIIRYLLQQRAQVDALIAKIREAVDRLKELRTALISAALTGKIDVREEAA